jgi:replicative DNA helicase
MNLKQVLERSLAKVTGMSIRELRLNGIPAEKEKLVMDYIGYMAEGNIYYRTGKIYASDIFRETQTLKQTTGVDIVFVDYLQFLADCWEDSRENLNIRVGKACKVLKNIVEELKVPVVVASQLSRAIEYRNKESKLPMLADLRDSGSIEQDADVVLLLYRDEDENDPTKLSNILQIKQAKGRQLGASSHINLVFDTKSNRYMDMVDREYQN